MTIPARLIPFAATLATAEKVRSPRQGPRHPLVTADTYDVQHRQCADEHPFPLDVLRTRTEIFATGGSAGSPCRAYCGCHTV